MSGARRRRWQAYACEHETDVDRKVPGRSICTPGRRKQHARLRRVQINGPGGDMHLLACPLPSPRLVSSVQRVLPRRSAATARLRARRVSWRRSELASARCWPTLSGWQRPRCWKPGAEPWLGDANGSLRKCWQTPRTLSGLVEHPASCFGVDWRSSWRRVKRTLALST